MPQICLGYAWDDLKNEDGLKNEDNIKNEGDLKNEDDLKNKDELKNWLPPANYFAPPPLKKLPKILFMTSHLEGHTATDVKPDMLSGVQTGNGIPHDGYNIRGIAHVRTNSKDDIFM